MAKKSIKKNTVLKKNKEEWVVVLKSDLKQSETEKDVTMR